MTSDLGSLYASYNENTNEWNGIYISYTGMMASHDNMHDVVLARFSSSWDLICKIFCKYTPDYINVYSLDSGGYYIVYSTSAEHLYTVRIIDGILQISRDAFMPWKYVRYYDLSDPECFSKMPRSGLVAEYNFIGE